MAGKPLWRQAFDKAERSVGARLEQFVQTDEFADAVSVAAQVRAQLTRRVEQASARVWHMANLPASSDVDRLHEQIAALERRLRTLTAHL